MPESPEAVREALESLSAERLASFAAALWRARGFTVSRSESRVTVARDDEERVLYVRAAGESEAVPAGVDGVITTTDDDVDVPTGVERIGPDTLTDYFRYAIPDVARTRLGAEYLGLDPAPDRNDGPGTDADRGAEQIDTVGDRSAAGPPGADGDDDTDGDRTAESESDRTTRTGTRRAVLVGAGAFVGGWGVGAATGIGPFGSGDSASADPPETPTPEPEPTVAVPGLSRDGVADANRLAEAHTNRIEATSFTISSIQTVHAQSGSLLASLGITTRIGADRRFQSEIATGGPDGRPLFGRYPAEAALFSAGDRLYRKLTVDGETTHRSAPLGFGVNGWFYWSSTYPFGSIYYSAEGFYRDLFASVPVSLTSIESDGDPPYQLVASGTSLAEPNPQTFPLVDADDGIEAVDLVATVTGSGLVESLRLAYEGQRDSAPATAQVTTRYRNLGDTTVERPEWVDRAAPD